MSPRTPPATPNAPAKETWIEQASSFIGFFVYLLVLKTYFLPLFIIPTGSMAEGLYGEHAAHACPNCGTEYAVGWQQPPFWAPPREAYDTRFHPGVLLCPNCRWPQWYDFGNRANLLQRGFQPSELLSQRLRPVAGDRIFVHGWPFEGAFAGLDAFGPQRWDVVVFKVPTDGDTNYIKRLIALPGEEVELIDGDVFINGRLVGKPRDAQRSLWFPYFNQDHPARAPTQRLDFHPRWVARDGSGAWTGLETRTLRCAAASGRRAELQFCTDPRNPLEAGRVQDLYGYNEPRNETPHSVTDVRLSAEVEFAAGDSAGYVELSTTKGPHQFFACLERDGTLRLQHNESGEDAPEAPRETWAETKLTPVNTPLHVALGHLDGVVTVEINRAPLLESIPSQYQITPATATTVGRPPVLRIAAENARLNLRHVLIERDVYYTSNIHLRDRPGYGVQGSPLKLGPDAYFLLGDNSPNSQDARFAFSRQDQPPVIAPHLRARSDYQPGTVPRDQLLGRAFFVYWPGFQPLTPRGPNLLPDFGRARWIH